MRDEARLDLRHAIDAWDRAMTTNDADAIGWFMAEDWTIVGPDGSLDGKQRFLDLVPYHGTPFSVVERVSSVFVRQDGSWRCVLTHLSRLDCTD